MSPEPPLDATGIARRHFSTVRRGYEPAEVRAFLHNVADMVGRLQRAEAHERERAERAETRAVLAEQFDQHRLVELLGEETARVLDSARAAAADIRTKAEESASRMLRDAQEKAHGVAEKAEFDAAERRVEILAEADALRRDAEAEVERCRSEGRSLLEEMRQEAEAERDRMLSDGESARAEAEAEAQAIRAAAEEQGSALVAEAQAVREHVLGDLARRRRSAREQLERLSAARDRLLTAYEVVRRTVDEAMSELTVVLPEAKAAGDLAMRRIHDQPEPTAEELEAELAVARMAGLVGGGGAHAPVGEGVEVGDGRDRGVPVLGEAPVGTAAPRAGGAVGSGEVAHDATGGDAAGGDDSDDAGEGSVATGAASQSTDQGAAGPVGDEHDGEAAAGDVHDAGAAAGGEQGIEVANGGAPGEPAAGVSAGSLDDHGVAQDGVPAGAAADIDAGGSTETGTDTGTDTGAGPTAPSQGSLLDDAGEGGAGPHGTGERWGLWPFRRRPPAHPEEEPGQGTGPGGAADEGDTGGTRPLAAADRVADATVARSDEGEDEAGDDLVVGRQEGGEGPSGTGERDRAGERDDTDDESPDAAHEPPGDSAGPSFGDAGEPDEGAGGEGGGGRVEELFARIKAERRGSTVLADEAPDGGTEARPSAGGVAVALADEPTPGPDDPAPGAIATATDDEVAKVADTGTDAAAADDTDAAAGDDESPAALGADDPDAARLLARDVTLADPERELSRRLKRVLADEQNEVFDLLRRATPAGAADVLPEPAEHAERYARAGLDELGAAARAGAESVGGRVPGAPAKLATEMGDAVVEPMRERIDRSFDECGGDLEEVTERLRSLYREWKGQRISSVVRHYTAAAFARGAYEAAPRGADLVWLVDRTGEPCPDADDNALAGRVRKGRKFPTGHRCAPAHPDCRCLVVPAD